MVVQHLGNHIHNTTRITINQNLKFTNGLTSVITSILALLIFRRRANARAVSGMGQYRRTTLFADNLIFVLLCVDIFSMGVISINNHKHNISGWLPDTMQICRVRGFLEHYGLLNVLFWNASMSIYLYLWIVKNKEPKNLMKTLKKTIIIMISVTLIPPLYAYVNMIYAPNAVDCWFNLTINLGLQFCLYYVWIMLALICVTGSLACIVSHIRSQIAYDTRAQQRLRRKMVLIAIAFTIIWLAVVTGEILEKSNNTLYINVGETIIFASGPACGWIDSFIYVMSFSYLKRIINVNKNICSRCFQWVLPGLGFLGFNFSGNLDGSRENREQMVSQMSCHTLLPPDRNLHQLGDSKELQIFTTTYNMAECKIEDIIHGIPAWIPLKYDLYAISIQECMCLNELKKAILLHLGMNTYTVFSQEIGSTNKTLGFHGMIAIIVFGRTLDVERGMLRELNLAKAAELNGLNLGITKAPNKGTVGICFCYYNTSLCFVGGHLASDSKGKIRTDKRHRDSIKALQETVQSGYDSQFDLHLRYHHTFILGDLNYRIRNLEPDHILTCVTKAANVEKLKSKEPTRWVQHAYEEFMDLQLIKDGYKDMMDLTINNDDIVLNNNTIETMNDSNNNNNNNDNNNNEFSKNNHTYKNVSDNEEEESHNESRYHDLEMPMPSKQSSSNNNNNNNNNNNSINLTIPISKTIFGRSNRFSPKPPQRQQVPEQPRLKNDHTISYQELPSEYGNSCTTSSYIESQSNNIDEWNFVLRHDELINAMANNSTFHDFYESPITFPPSFRRNIGRAGECGDYSDVELLKKAYTLTASDGTIRRPSYTDRILLHSLPCRRKNIKCGPYRLCDALTASDHRPVSQALQISVDCMGGAFKYLDLGIEDLASNGLKRTGSLLYDSSYVGMSYSGSSVSNKQYNGSYDENMSKWHKLFDMRNFILRSSTNLSNLTKNVSRSQHGSGNQSGSGSQSQSRYESDSRHGNVDISNSGQSRVSDSSNHGKSDRKESIDDSSSMSEIPPEPIRLCKSGTSLISEKSYSVYSKNSMDELTPDRHVKEDKPKTASYKMKTINITISNLKIEYYEMPQSLKRSHMSTATATTKTNSIPVSSTDNNNIELPEKTPIMDSGTDSYAPLPQSILKRQSSSLYVITPQLFGQETSTESQSQSRVSRIKDSIPTNPLRSLFYSRLSSNWESSSGVKSSSGMADKFEPKDIKPQNVCILFPVSSEDPFANLRSICSLQRNLMGNDLYTASKETNNNDVSSKANLKQNYFLNSLHEISYKGYEQNNNSFTFTADVAYKHSRTFLLKLEHESGADIGQIYVCLDCVGEQGNRACIKSALTVGGVQVGVIELDVVVRETYKSTRKFLRNIMKKESKVQTPENTGQPPVSSRLSKQPSIEEEKNKTFENMRTRSPVSSSRGKKSSSSSSGRGGSRSPYLQVAVGSGRGGSRSPYLQVAVDNEESNSNRERDSEISVLTQLSPKTKEL